MAKQKSEVGELYSKKSLNVIKKYAPLYGIIGSSKINPVQRKGLIDSLNATQLGGYICILRDVVKNADKLPSDFTSLLHKNRKDIEQLLGKAGKNTNVRKKVLSQKGGFIGALLGALVSATLPLIVKGIQKGKRRKR